MEPFFSVVMPIYNAEDYLSEAVNSVLAQSYKSFELILVNDASTDKSGALMDAFAQTCASVFVEHLPKNLGLSGARNAGLDLARGRYIWFMDADDTVESDLLQAVAQSLAKNPADAVLFGMREEYYDASGLLRRTHEVVWHEAVLDKEALRKEVIRLESASLYGYAWNKVYSLGRLKALKLRFENVRLIEDIRFNAAFFMDASSLNCLSGAPYRYKKRGINSLTAKFAPEYYALHVERVELIKKQYQYWGLYDDAVKQTLGGIYARFMLSALQRNCDKHAHMNHAQRKSFAKELVKSPLYRELIPHARPVSPAARALAAALKTNSALACLTLGRAVYAVQRGMPMLFASIKQSR